MESIEEIAKRVEVLVVDDMEAMRSMVGSCLKDIGVEKITFSGNGDVAWKQINSKRIDLIICDLDMPEVSGLELLDMVRGSKRFNHVPFLMLTATTEKKKVLDIIKLGANDYLAKPFQPKELEYRVIRLFRKVKKG